jgi:tRNA 5-methylaminomethyl-2-thiouridine biosynthesis bifunctional protein
VMEHRPPGNTLWHANACWIKPAKLVEAWLAQPCIQFVGNCPVTELQHADGRWHLRGQQGKELGQFETVVLANAMGSAALLGSDIRQALTTLQPVHGTLSYGNYAQTIPDLPAIPINGVGCFIPHVPGVDAEQWFAGSTFEPDAALAADSRAQHALNMARLRQLMPLHGGNWTDLLEQGTVKQWSSTRCVTHDRMPFVGPVETGRDAVVWLCIGMGSRGLSFSALCAELIAARIGGEPLPMESSLSRSLDVDRVRRRSSAKPIG